MDAEEYLRRAVERGGLPPHKFLEYAVMGALAHGALYLVLVFAAAVHFDRGPSMELAAATAGIVYLSCTAYCLRLDLVGAVLSAVSVACGIAAGLTLVW